MYNFDEIIPREGTHCVKYDLRQELFGTKTALPLWVADMDFRTPDFIMEAIRKRTEHEILGYTFQPASFFDAIIGWNETRHQWKIQKEWIAFSPGVVPAFNMAIMAFSNPEDKIIVQPPVYHPFFAAIRGNDRILTENPLIFEDGQYKMDFEDLESKIDEKTRVLLFCSPHNPGGRVWKREELQKLGDICRKHNIVIVSDEIHADLTLFGHRHTPMASVSPEIADITITLMAPSKTFNTAALATSYAIASNAELLKKFTAITEQLHISWGNVFGSVALEAAYTNGSEWLVQLKSYIEENILFLESFIKENMPQIEVIRPEATYLVMLDFRKLKLNTKDLKKLLLEDAGVALNDGITFGRQARGFQRINVACPRATLEEALKRIHGAVEKL